MTTYIFRRIMLSLFCMWALQTSAASLVAGEHHSCSITYGGEVACWGLNTKGQLGDGTSQSRSAPTPIAELKEVTSLAAGNEHSCALSKGQIFCWGNNSHGQLGTGNSQNATKPMTVMGLNNVTSIAAGGDHSCAINNNRRVFCWGENDNGQLGDGTTSSRNKPHEVSGIGDTIQIVAGSKHTCALSASGLIHCWGANTRGQLGNSGFDNSLLPVLIPGRTIATQLTSGANHSCALMDTKVWCWGDNTYSQLGRLNAANSRTPIQIPGLEATNLGAGYFHTCALNKQNRLSCWGNNQDGQLGIGFESASHTNSTAISALDNPIAFVAGGYHTCSLTEAGALFCWGSNQFGQLGNGSTVKKTTPAVVPTLSHYLTITHGKSSCATTVGGGGTCWQLHIDYPKVSPTPVPIPNVDKIQSVTVGGLAGYTWQTPRYTYSWPRIDSHYCLVANDKAACLGENYYGQSGLPKKYNFVNTPNFMDTLTEVKEVTTGALHSCALRANGTVWCWGDNSVGQVGSDLISDAIGVQDASIPRKVNTLVNAKSLATGKAHNCIVSVDNDVYCWGYNAFGQIGANGTDRVFTPTKVSAFGKVRQIAATLDATCALTIDDSVICIGQSLKIPKIISLPRDTVSLTSSQFSIANKLTGQYCAATRQSETYCWSVLENPPTQVIVKKGVKIQPGPCELSQKGADCAFMTDGAVFRKTPIFIPYRISAQRVPAVPSVHSIAAGDQHTCALQNADIFCWGNNRYGQLADNGVAPRLLPDITTTLNNTTELAGGAAHNCALQNNTQVLCWGKNLHGQIGDGSFDDQLTPKIVAGLSGVKKLSLGDNHTCAATALGTVQCLGNNVYGQLGNGNNIDSPSPVTVPGLSNIAGIGSGPLHTCAFDTSGQVYCWGFNVYRELYDDEKKFVRASTIPVAIPELSGVIQIAAGIEHTCALTNRGQVWCWGYNISGQLGAGNRNLNITPKPVRNLAGVEKIAAGFWHTCALDKDKSLRCWGNNEYGQLGTGDTHDRLLPEIVPGIDKVTALGAGARHTCVAQENGTYCWGDSAVGQTGTNFLESRPAINLVAVDYHHQIKRFLAWMEQQNPTRFSSSGAIDIVNNQQWLRTYSSGETVRIDGWDFYLQKSSGVEIYMGNLSTWMAVL